MILSWVALVSWHPLHEKPQFVSIHVKNAKAHEQVSKCIYELAFQSCGYYLALQHLYICWQTTDTACMQVKQEEESVNFERKERSEEDVSHCRREKQEKANERASFGLALINALFLRQKSMCTYKSPVALLHTHTYRICSTSIYFSKSLIQFDGKEYHVL